MKKKVWIPLLFAIIALMSCNEDDYYALEESSNVMFNFSASVPDATNQTKTVTINRYIVEIYKTSAPTTLVKRVEQAGGSIVTNLEPNTNYICLFWADGVTPDDNANGTFNASSLKNVTLNTGKDMTDAFFARLDITDAKTTFDVVLKRATAQVNMIATDIITANADLVVTYNQHNSFNTFTSEVTGIAVATSKTFNSSATTGTLGTFLTFASVVGILTDFTAVYNSAITNEMKYTALKANYVTNIRGGYSTSIQDFTFIIVPEESWKDLIGGVQINVGSVASPTWIKVADRNAMKGGGNGATTDATAVSYGYYYQWSNSTTDPTNVEKAYRACFDFGEGNGAWRLPTKVEWTIVAGNSGEDHKVDANRKLKWANGPAWKLYDERVGQESNFVYFPISGFITENSGSSGAQFVGNYAFYWTSTPFTSISGSGGILGLYNDGSSLTSNGNGTTGSPVRCVKNI